MGTMIENCGMMMGSMGWMMPIVGIGFLLLLGMGIAALAKYLFAR